MTNGGMQFAEQKDPLGEKGYRKDPKVSDRQVCENGANTDQTADQGLHCLRLHLHLLDALPYGKTTPKF